MVLIMCTDEKISSVLVDGQNGTDAQPGPRTNILIVDDRPENLFALEAMLKPLGQNILAAKSGEEALKCLLEREFAVILLDVMMPGMDGFETASLVRKREKSRCTPIVFVTSLGKDETYVSKGYSLGAVDYLFKPIVPEILKAKVTVFVELYERTEEIKRQALREKQIQQEKELAEKNLRLQREEHMRALEQKAEQLAASNAELEQFAYVISHDLQEPLRMVSSYLQLLAKRYVSKLDSDADEFINFAVDGATRMKELINDLLTLSRVISRRKPFEPTDANSVFAGVIDNLKMTIEESGVEVTHDPLPTVMADGTQLGQMMQNLVENAIKFRGNDSPCVHVSAEQNGEDWVFTVRDNGIGINPDYYDRIFMVFQRLHGTGEYSGSGIGLAICKKIVERHGGRIWVESKPGEGSTFCFALPVDREKDDA